MIFVVFVEVEGGKHMCMYYNMYLYVFMLYTYYPTSPRNFVGITRSSGGSRGTPGPCAAAAQRAPWTTLRMLREVLLGRNGQKIVVRWHIMTHHTSIYIYTYIHQKFMTHQISIYFIMADSWAILVSGNRYVPLLWEFCWGLHNSCGFNGGGIVFDQTINILVFDLYRALFSGKANAFSVRVDGSFCHSLPLRFAALVACFMGATDGLSLGTLSLDPMADVVTWTMRFWILGYPSISLYDRGVPYDYPSVAELKRNSWIISWRWPAVSFISQVSVAWRSRAWGLSNGSND